MNVAKFRRAKYKYAYKLNYSSEAATAAVAEYGRTENIEATRDRPR